jgi:hypothetical protein
LWRAAFDTKWKNGARQLGVRYINYEAGQHIVDSGAAWKAANNLVQTGGSGATSPISMQAEYCANLDQLAANTQAGAPGVALSLQYTLRSRQTNYPSGTWGLGDNFSSTPAESPKLRAVASWGR